jgi:hypothetical protein
MVFLNSLTTASIKFLQGKKATMKGISEKDMLLKDLSPTHQQIQDEVLIYLVRLTTFLVPQTQNLKLCLGFSFVQQDSNCTHKIFFFKAKN